MERRNLVSGVLALCALTSAGWAQTTDFTTLLNENFNELTPMLGATSVGAFHTINGTNVDIVGGDLFGSLCAANGISGRPKSGNCIDLNGTGGNPQGVLRSNTAFSIVPGFYYFIEFDLVGSQRGNTTSTTVTFGDFNETFTLTSGDITSNVPVTITIPPSVSAPTTAFLTFTADQGGDVGPLLDNVTLASFRFANPEPATLGLLVLGLAGVGFARRKRCG